LTPPSPLFFFFHPSITNSCSCSCRALDRISEVFSLRTRFSPQTNTVLGSRMLRPSPPADLPLFFAQAHFFLGVVSLYFHLPLLSDFLFLLSAFNRVGRKGLLSKLSPLWFSTPRSSLQINNGFCSFFLICTVPPFPPSSRYS